MNTSSLATQASKQACIRACMQAWLIDWLMVNLVCWLLSWWLLVFLFVVLVVNYSVLKWAQLIFHYGAWNFGFGWAKTITTHKDLVLNHLGVVYQALCSGRICAKSMVLLRYILLGILKFGGFRHVNRYIAGSNAELCLVALWLLRSLNISPS